MRQKIKIGHNKPPKRAIKKAKRQSPKLLKEFIFKLLPMEQYMWRKVAGTSGVKVYQYIKWKRGMMKHNGWIALPYIEMLKHGWGMNRETKAKAIWKLNRAQLIEIQPLQPGKAYKVFRPDIKGEYDGR